MTGDVVLLRTPVHGKRIAWLIQAASQCIEQRCVLSQKASLVPSKHMLFGDSQPCSAATCCHVVPALLCHNLNLLARHMYQLHIVQAHPCSRSSSSRCRRY
jgi:hypothetical protein